MRAGEKNSFAAAVERKLQAERISACIDFEMMRLQVAVCDRVQGIENETAAADLRRLQAQATLCRLDSPGEVEAGLIALWRDPDTRLAA